ncbi:MAG: hypothetical protein AAF388_21540 [Bacteroidota bacterium]
MSKNNQINSLKELEAVLPKVLKTINTDENLSLAAAYNPILAMEKVGLAFSEGAKSEIELNIRFGKQKAKEVSRMEKEIIQLAGEPLNLEDAQSVSKFISKQLRSVKLSKIPKSVNAKNKQDLTRKVLRFVQNKAESSGKSREFDPSILKFLDEKESVISKIIRYQILQLRFPRFGTQEGFDKLLYGEVSVPISGIKFSLRNPQAT